MKILNRGQIHQFAENFDEIESEIKKYELGSYNIKANPKYSDVLKFLEKDNILSDQVLLNTTNFDGILQKQQQKLKIIILSNY